jgi:tellurite resistance protein TerC
MYFLLADLIHRFIYLKLGLALVLIWVGIKMLLKIDVYYIPTALSLAVVTLILGVSVTASMIATRGQRRQVLQTPEHPPFRTASEDEIEATTSVWRRSPTTSVQR